MNTNDFFELKKSYDTSQMPEKEVIKMKEKMNQAKAEKKNKHNKTIITRIWVGAAAAIAAFVILPNTSPSVAYAMEQIPLLGNLIEVVTFRDYQYSSDRNNADVNVPKLVPETVASTEKTTEDPVGENLKKSTDEINAEIEKISDSLIAEFKQNMNNEGYQDIMIKHEVINTTDDYFTLKLMCYQAAGSGYEMDYYYTIDLKTRERLALKDLLKRDLTISLRSVKTSNPRCAGRWMPMKMSPTGWMIRKFLNGTLPPLTMTLPSILMLTEISSSASTRAMSVRCLWVLWNLRSRTM